MADLEVIRGDGTRTTIKADAVDQLKASLRGELLLRGDDGYDDARTIWNAMIDRHPALIVKCAGVADVQAAIRFASANQLLTAVHGGGHNIAGNAVCDGGMMINLSEMNNVQIDPVNKRAHVGPGATLGDLDHEAQAFNLIVPAGINSITGVAGLTLGGGFGWISRKYGMTVDSLRAVDLVTAEGELVHASETDNPDLFWAVRGGSGNFGVVTRFEFECHPFGPMIHSGLIVFPHDESVAVLKKYRECAATLTDDTSVWVVLRQAPPLPFLPENVHGTNVLVLALCHIGDATEGEKIAESLRSFGTVLGEHVGQMPFTAWQQAFDPLLMPGERNYWKSHNFTTLDDGLFECVAKYAGDLPSNQTEIFIGALGGAINRVPADATAYPHREAEFLMNVHGRWSNASDDDKCVAWSREFFKASEKYASGGVYINFLTAEESERIGNAYGPGMERLKKVKQKYDPNNLFRMNQNIKP